MCFPQKCEFIGFPRKNPSEMVGFLQHVVNKNLHSKDFSMKMIENALGTMKP